MVMEIWPWPRWPFYAWLAGGTRACCARWLYNLMVVLCSVTTLFFNANPLAALRRLLHADADAWSRCPTWASRANASTGST
jgi:hypothetical protein